MLHVSSFMIRGFGVDPPSIFHYTTPMNSETKLYELSYLLVVESEEEIHSVNELARAYIENGKGMVLEAAKPSRRHLAYPIQKVSEAYFGYIKFYLPPAQVRALEERVAHEKGVLRFMIALSKRLEAMATRRPKRELVRPLKQEEKPAADIASIDKKLEEILGK